MYYKNTKKVTKKVLTESFQYSACVIDHIAALYKAKPMYYMERHLRLTYNVFQL